MAMAGKARHAIDDLVRRHAGALALPHRGGRLPRTILDPLQLLFEETHRTTALPTGGDRRSVLKPHRDWLLELRRKENDLTLDAIAERLLRTHGVEADKSMLSRFYAAEGISFKKNRARQRAGSSRRR